MPSDFPLNPLRPFAFRLFDAVLSPPVFYFGLSSIITFNIYMWTKFDMMRDRVSGDGVSFFNNFEENFDFIVVGSGSSGAVVANRLSKHFRVLLLEAGGDPYPGSSMPAASLSLLNREYIDWRYQTTPQKHACFGMKNNVCNVARGKGLGGSSNLNFLQYARGSPEDYDEWARITGDSRWSYSQILRYFIKSEDYLSQGWNYDFDNNFHGRGGFLKINYPPYIAKITENFLQAGQEFGFKQVDLNAPYSQGFDKVLYTQKDGSRAGTFQAFIKPIRGRRKNLKIYKFATVYKILTKGPENTAYGVVYERHGVIKKAFASKEIILSAGAIGSPQILMLSGFGPWAHLKSLGIKVKVDLPGVGQNLQDHIGSYTTFTLKKPDLTLSAYKESLPKAAYEFTFQGKGILTTTGLMGTAFLSSSINLQTSRPDLQWIFLGVSTNPQSVQLTEDAFNFRTGSLDKFFRPIYDVDSFQICSILSRPTSKGEILLRDSNPRSKPYINPNYLSKPEEIQVLIEGMKRSVELVENSTSFRKVGGKLSPVPYPGCGQFPFRSTLYWECYIRSFSLTIFHPVGTCAMNSVVNSELKVYGTRNLRVIDASIMPNIVSSNTNAACIMIGERGAQFIIDQYLPSKNHYGY